MRVDATRVPLSTRLVVTSFSLEIRQRVGGKFRNWSGDDYYADGLRVARLFVLIDIQVVAYVKLARATRPAARE